MPGARSQQPQCSTPSATTQPSLWPPLDDALHEPAAAVPPCPGESAEPIDAEMARARRRHTPSFVCEVPLRVGPREARVLKTRLEVACVLYNACLGEGRRRWFLVKQSRAYQRAHTLPKATPERTAAFKAAFAAHGFTEAALQAYAKECRHQSGWIELNLDAPVSQQLATRAYRAVLRMALGKAHRVRFKGKGQLDTVEGKSNTAGLVWRGDRVMWRGLTLLACLPRRTQTDAVLAHGLAAQVKYVRLVRRRIKEQTRFWAQLICEGTPYYKPRHEIGQGHVGLDLGPSMVAVVTPAAARLEAFCAELDLHRADTRRLERHLDRQRRANNPDNYEANGTVKKGRKGRKYWRESQRQRRTQATLSDRQRRLAAHRKSLHGRLAHEILRQGNTVLLEKVSYRAWQRRYGRSIQRRAPGTFVQILSRAAASAHGRIITVPTRTTKLSQRCQCGSSKKKPLSQRVHHCEVCGLQMQRDLYSAYLIRFVDEQTPYLFHADQAREAWPGAEPLLRAAWQQAIPTSQPARGTTRSRRSHVQQRGATGRQSRSSAEGPLAQPKGSEAVTPGA
jgi:putative transposase